MQVRLFGKNDIWNIRAGFTDWHNIGTGSLHVFQYLWNISKSYFWTSCFLSTIPYSRKESTNDPVRHCIASIVGSAVLKMRRCQSFGSKYYFVLQSCAEINLRDLIICFRNIVRAHWRVPRLCKFQIEKDTSTSSISSVAKRFVLYWKFGYILVLVQWCNGACNMPLDAPFPNVWAVPIYQRTIYRRFHQI